MIDETPVYIKTYAAYHRKQDNRFIGLRNTGAYKTLYNWLLLPGETMYRSGMAEEELIVSQNVYKEGKTPGESELDDKGDIFNRALAVGIIDKYIYEVPNLINSRDGTCKLFHDPDGVNHDRLHPRERPAKEGVVPVEPGTYVLIFRQEGKEVYLRAEYQYLEDNLWHPVDIENLSDNRKTSAGGGVRFKIPSNQTCYLMLSRIRLSAARITNIRETLKRDGSAKNCHRVTTIGPFVQEGNIKAHTKDRLISMRDSENEGKASERYLYAGDDSIENLLVEDGEDVLTIVLPDYEGYAMTLGKRFDEQYNEYISNLGETSVEQHLKFLVSNVCNEYSCWGNIEGGRESDTGKMLQSYDEALKLTIARMNMLAVNLAWWIFQPGYQELLYDYVFYYRYDDTKRNNIIEDLFVNNIDKLYQIPVTGPTFEYYYQQAYDVYKEVLKQRGFADAVQNMEKFDSEYFIQYWITGNWPENAKIRDDFETLALYNENKTMVKNYFAEVFYPQFKNARTISLNILKCFAYPIITTEGKRIEIGQLPKLWQARLYTITKESSVIVEDYRSGVVQAGNRSFNLVSVWTMGPKDTATKIAESRIFEELKKCIAIFDFYFAAYNLMKKRDVVNSLALASATMELAKAWKFIDEGAKGSFKNFVLSNSKSLFDVAIGIFKMKKLIYEGDHLAAGLTGGTIAIQIASLVCAGMKIVNGPHALIFFIATLVLKMLIEETTSTEIEKWVKFGFYGRDYQSIINGTYERNNTGWRPFYEKNVAYYMRDDSNDIMPITEGIDKWIENYEITKDGKPVIIDARQNHIDCYYRIIGDFEVMISKFSDEADGLSKYSADPSRMDLLRIECKTPVLTPDNEFKINLNVAYNDPSGKLQEYKKEYSLSYNNSMTQYDEKEGFRLICYIYNKPFSNPFSDLFNTPRENRQNNRVGMDSVKIAASLYKDHPEGITIPSYIVDNDLFTFFNKQYTEHDTLYDVHTEVKTAKKISGTIVMYNKPERETGSKAIIVKDIKKEMIRETAWNYVQVYGRK